MSGVQKGIKIAAIVLAIFIICLIVNGILSLVGFLGYFTGDKDYIENYNNISKVEIDITSSNIEIKYGSEFRIEATNVSDNFKVKEKTGTLYIDEEDFWFWGNGGGNIVLYVPRELEELNIDTGAGNTKISEITAKKLNLDQGSGLINISNSTFYESEIDGGTGSIQVIDSLFEDMEMDCGVGVINFNGEILGKNSISAGIGKINIKLVGGEELYTLKVDKGLGSLDIDGVNYSNSTYGNGNNKIYIDEGIGDINISFD